MDNQLIVVDPAVSSLITAPKQAAYFLDLDWERMEVIGRDGVTYQVIVLFEVTFGEIRKVWIEPVYDPSIRVAMIYG